MANIAFISLYDRNAYGLRLMSASLKKHGHQCHIIFLKRYDTSPTYRMDLEVGEYPWMGVGKSGRTYKYAANSHISQTEIELLRETLEQIRPDIIGMTVNTPLRVQAIRVTKFIKEHFTAPVVWGGYDPTVNIADCLDLCDYVCIGEGDQTILDIAQRADEKRSLDDVNNLAFRRSGKTVINRKNPLEQNLDKYPWRDNSPENKYLIEDGAVEANHPRLSDRPVGVYLAMSARGCPYHCSYCCEATLKEIYDGEKFLRRRSPKDLVSELAEVKREHGINRLQFEDEIFAMDVRWLEEFVALYRREIGLPFSAYIYPTLTIDTILPLLKSAGLDYCCLALESGSERISRDVFDRVYDRELFLKTARLCKDLHITFYTDVITYNPYEEEEDLEKTLDLLMDIGGGFDLWINKLFVLPGTKLAMRMKQDNVQVGNSEKDRMFDYYCRLFWISSFTRRARTIIALIRHIGIFRRCPRLLNPVLIEALVNPVSAAKWLVRNWLPRPIYEGLRTYKAKLRLALRHNP